MQGVERTRPNLCLHCVVWTNIWLRLVTIFGQIFVMRWLVNCLWKILVRNTIRGGVVEDIDWASWCLTMPRKKCAGCIYVSAHYGWTCSMWRRENGGIREKKDWAVVLETRRHLSGHLPAAGQPNWLTCLGQYWSFSMMHSGNCSESCVCCECHCPPEGPRPGHKGVRFTLCRMLSALKGEEVFCRLHFCGVAPCSGCLLVVFLYLPCASLWWQFHWCRLQAARQNSQQLETSAFFLQMVVSW